MIRAAADGYAVEVEGDARLEFARENRRGSMKFTCAVVKRPVVVIQTDGIARQTTRRMVKCFHASTGFARSAG